MRKNRIKGFTILELLVVVAIIAIIAVIVMPNFIGQADKAKASRELAEIDAVHKALSTYYADNGVYPTLQGKDGSVAQAQPVVGSPHNLDFSELVPDYLATLPHFSYWWVDYNGKVYHTEKSLGTLSGTTFTPVSGYKFYLNGSTTAMAGPTTLAVNDYITGKDDKGKELPRLTLSYKNEKIHPESGEVAPPPQTPVSYTADIIPTMTSNTSPSGVAAASSIYGSGYDAFKAFDGVTGTLWNTPAWVTTGWITYEFPTAKKVCKYSIRTTHSTTDISSSLKTWTLQGSNDGVTWTVLDTRTNEPSWAVTEKREYTFTNNTAYKKYKLDVTANHSGAYVVIAELEMYEVVY